MKPKDTLNIVGRLVIAGLIPAREGQGPIWHEAIGHLDYQAALDGVVWLERNRGSDAYGPAKPADVIDAAKRVRSERVPQNMPEPPIDPADVTRHLAWQREWRSACADGLTSEQAEARADQALGIVRAAVTTRQRPVAELVASVAAGLRMPKRDEAEPQRESA